MVLLEPVQVQPCQTQVFWFLNNHNVPLVSKFLYLYTSAPPFPRVPSSPVCLCKRSICDNRDKNLLWGSKVVSYALFHVLLACICSTRHRAERVFQIGQNHNLSYERHFKNHNHNVVTKLQTSSQHNCPALSKSLDRHKELQLHESFEVTHFQRIFTNELEIINWNVCWSPWTEFGSSY